MTGTHLHPPPIDHSDEAPEEELVLWELVQTAHLAAQTFRDLFATVGLTPTQFGVLACLADGDDFTKAELARALSGPTPEHGPAHRDPPQRAAGRARRTGRTREGGRHHRRHHGAGKLAQIRPRVHQVNAPERIGVDAAQAPLLIAQLRAIRARLSP